MGEVEPAMEGRPYFPTPGPPVLCGPEKLNPNIDVVMTYVRTGANQSFCCIPWLPPLLCCAVEREHEVLTMTRSPRLQRTFLVRLAASLLWVLLTAMALAASAADGPPNASDADTVLSDARKQIDDIREDLADGGEDAKLVRWRADVLDIQSQADALAEALAPQLASVTARLGQLGVPQQDTQETSDMAAQRAQLEKTHRTLDSQTKLARLLSVEAMQTAEQISNLRRTQFQASLGERRDSFLATPFWSEFRGDLPRDLVRLSALTTELRQALDKTPGWTWVVMVAAIGLVVALRIWIGRLLLKLTATHVPPGRLRRSFLAVALVALSVATPGLVAELLLVGTTWDADLTERTQQLLGKLVAVVCFGGYVAGLGYALLAPDRPSWRLPAIPDRVVQGLRHVPTMLGVLSVLIWLAERLPVLLNASLTTTMAVIALAAVLLGGTLAWTLRRASRLQREAASEGMDSAARPRPFWLDTLAAATWWALMVSVASLLVGYVAFGSFIIKQALWTLIVLCSAYLLSVLIEDGFSTLLSPAKREDDEPARLRDQAGVLLSGLGRVAVVLFAVVLLLAPFGEGPVDLVHRFDLLYKGLQVGEVQIRPGAVLQALLVLALSLLSLRLLKRWLTNRYLPTTDMDPGMQLSAATLFGYAGFVLAVALALSALGIGLERVAWIASALSVGIGFGLQAVVQNFVSGLILLAERPVKVGDWVSLGGVEGDILRINVRATEIQMGDRSTVIVPNSEFVTKTVRNVTHANPLGLVQIKLPMPLDTDAEQVRTLMRDAFGAHEGILETPAPDVFLDGIENNYLMFNARGYVSSPRAAYGVRSALLFDILKRLADTELAMTAQSTTMLLGPAPVQDAAPAQPATPR